MSLLLLAALQDGYSDIFNGRDLTGFKPVHCAADTFSFQGSELVCSGKPAGYLMSEKRYRNFSLRYDWKFETPGNNGCLLFIAEPDALDIWPRSIEVQGMHAQAGLILPIPRNLGVTHTDHPAARRAALKPAGEWNTFEIVVAAGGGAILLNGRRVSEFRGCVVQEGPIGFQAEGAPIRFRNVKIREEDGARGLAFSPTIGEEQGYAVIDTFGATVRYTRDGSEPTRTSSVYTVPSGPRRETLSSRRPCPRTTPGCGRRERRWRAGA